MSLTLIRPGRQLYVQIMLVLAAGTALAVWLALTPPGLLGKADAIAYAVCHRIASHSFFAGDRQDPLCARCTGMYLGALLGWIYLTRFGRRGSLPRRKFTLVFLLFLAAFGLDGVNSYLHLLPGMPGLYTPHNWLRLATGTGMGLGIAVILLPVFNQTMWQQYSEEPVINGWKQLFFLLALAAIMDLVVLTGNPLLLYPLEVCSAFTVLMILTVVYSVVWTMISKQENRFLSTGGMWTLLTAGLLTALVQIGLSDIARFALTHTWGGLKI